MSYECEKKRYTIFFTQKQNNMLDSRVPMINVKCNKSYNITQY